MVQKGVEYGNQRGGFAFSGIKLDWRKQRNAFFDRSFRSQVMGDLLSHNPTSPSETPFPIRSPGSQKVPNSQKMELYIFGKLQRALRLAGFGINQALKSAQLGSIGWPISSRMG